VHYLRIKVKRIAVEIKFGRDLELFGGAKSADITK
jgi:hypothetical protein